jgi:uncharacterized membrane protein SpoIIM required for sporulation
MLSKSPLNGLQMCISLVLPKGAFEFRTIVVLGARGIARAIGHDPLFPAHSDFTITQQINSAITVLICIRVWTGTGYPYYFVVHFRPSKLISR